MQEKDVGNQDVVLQSVSALMDGEGSELDLRRVLKASASDPAVLERWQRYHLVRSSLRQESHTRPGINLLAGIHARLDAEAIPQAPARSWVSSPRAARFLRHVGQGTIAASVAVVALFAASRLQVESGAAGDMSADRGAIAVQAADVMPSLGGDFTPSELARTVSMDAAARRRLQQAVYQSSGLQPHPFGEPYVFPESPEVDTAGSGAELVPLDPSALR